MYGFNEDAVGYSLQSQLGAPVRRMAIGWNTVQPTPSSWDWSKSDAEYSALHANGLRPLIYVAAPPCWTHPEDCSGSDGTLFLQDPAYDSAWSQFVQRVAHRYPDAVAIEVWNEENLDAYYIRNFVNPYTFISRYTQTVKLAHSAAAGSHIPVIVGGLFRYGDTSSLYSDETFLWVMYEDGLRGNADGIGTHPYPIGTDQNGTEFYDTALMEQTLARLRTARNHAGDTIPLWITEVGESTWNGTPTVTEAHQATDLITMLDQAKSDGDVRAFLIDRLINTNVSWSPIDAGQGVFHADGTPKPAACAISATLGGSLHC